MGFILKEKLKRHTDSNLVYSGYSGGRTNYSIRIIYFHIFSPHNKVENEEG